MKTTKGVIALLILLIALVLSACAENHRAFEDTALDVPPIAVHGVNKRYRKTIFPYSAHLVCSAL